MFLYILNESKPEFRLAVIKKTDLVRQLCVADEKNRAEESKQGGIRRSYMGHLLNLASNIKTIAKDNVDIRKILEEEPKWDEMNKISLADKERIQSKPLGGVVPEKPSLLDDHHFAAYNTETNATDDPDSKSDSEDSESSEDQELDLDDDVDLDSETDADDYDIDQAEVLLSKQEIEAVE
eukprot:TRINITY_DN4636_c0_g1_i1.p1 TRINITY_DN4636_c0_g1~~TRINITY_DN4636_c0_g1_i1.p1  ORF type:complete len:180 (-),score=38.42 TRINITY_DN4636_c0_g1_i1:37-576(-)